MCDHVCDFHWIRFDCVGRRVIENTEWKRIVSLKSWMIDFGVGLFITMDHCMVNRMETSVEIVNSIEEGSLWWIGMSWVDGNEAMDWIRYDENGKEWWWLQLRDSNARRCRWYRIDLNEMRSRIQGIADSHDSSPTLRLSEEIKRMRQNQPIISFHKRIHRLIQHHKRSQSSKQQTLWIENPFCFQGVVFIQQQTISFTSTMSKHLLNSFHTSFGP